MTATGPLVGVIAATLMVSPSNPGAGAGSPPCSPPSPEADAASSSDRPPPHAAAASDSARRRLNGRSRRLCCTCSPLCVCGCWCLWSVGSARSACPVSGRWAPGWSAHRRERGIRAAWSVGERPREEPRLDPEPERGQATRLEEQEEHDGETEEDRVQLPDGEQARIVA